MKNTKRPTGRLATAMAGLLVVSAIARADVTSDKAAAIVIWPFVGVGNQIGGDTLVQLSNTGTNPVDVHCFYVNANSHCTNTGEVCSFGFRCCDGGSCGLCLPGWNETDFHVTLTARQPIAWQVSEGLQDFCSSQQDFYSCIPLDGTTRRGPKDPTDPSGARFQSNAGTRIPSAPEDPFIGELKCIAVDSTGAPLTGPGANVLIGEGTLEIIDNPGGQLRVDVGKFNAIGIRALDNPADDGDPSHLVLQTNGGEYEGCPNVLILDHFFDGAIDPVKTADPQTVITFEALVPCSENLRTQVPGSAVAQYLVFNEFEQRFSTSRLVQCLQVTPLSLIDTTQPENSIFNAGVSGTLTGQTRISPLGSGLIAVAAEFHGFVGGATGTQAILLAAQRGHQADVNVHYQGQRTAPDTITLP